MDQRATLLLVLCVAITLSTWACNVSFSTARITDATMAKEVNANKEAVAPVDSFEPDVAKIHCVVKVANAPEDTKLRARWIAVKAERQKPNDKFAELDATVGNNAVFDFNYTPPPSGMPVGEYKVEIYLNPKSDTDQPTKTLPFTVKGE